MECFNTFSEKKGSQIKRWSCCKRSYQSEGCQRYMAHVHQQNVYDDLEGYVRMPKATEAQADKQCEVFAIGCEMVYFSRHTTHKTIHTNNVQLL